MSTQQRVLTGLVAASMLVALAGCAAAPEETTPTETTAGAVEGFLPCIVSGASPAGFEDKSFNQLGLKGLTEAADELGVDFKQVQSKSSSDFAPNISSLIDQGCTLITTVGFDLASAAGQAALANPDLQFVSIDDTVDMDFDGKTDAPNIKPVIFDTAQAAFLAGYSAASYSSDKAKKVGTFGGQNFPTVAIFMDGYKQGVDYWNEQKGDTVEVIGWDGTDGEFTGAFAADQAAINKAQGLVDQGVDAILPVGGEIYLSAASVIRDSGREIALLGVDADVYETDPTVADLLLTSILKAVDVGTKEAVVSAGTGDFDVTPFVGTLENEGVGIAPFHDWEDKVSPDLQGELDTIKAGIIDGSIKVTSFLSK